MPVIRLPVVRGIIDRRILANYRVRPADLQPLLPAPFRPKLVDRWGMAGICLIRLRGIRPRAVPSFVPLGISSENAAHRIAVEWDEGAGRRREGVYIVRRDSSSRLNALAGGRLFPGVHHHATFDVSEDDAGGSYRVRVDSGDGRTRLALAARRVDHLPESSVFGTLENASAFFEAGSVGYSPARHAGTLDGLELRSEGWKVEPLAVESIRSSFFDDPSRFPPGAAEFDCALLMRGIRHEWHAREAPGATCC